jgi:putative transcriptional regulator
MAPPAPLRPATDAEIRAAAKSDPDARPWTEAGVAGARKISPARNIRRILGLTQEEFAARFHIPVGTLRDWEQGRSEPD